MPLPHRGNPAIKTNWDNQNNSEVREEKKSYYEIDVAEDKLVIRFREEKQKLDDGSAKESDWFGHLEFDLDDKFARDLLMVLKDNAGK